jgi:hypothetical protein
LARAFVQDGQVRGLVAAGAVSVVVAGLTDSAEQHWGEAAVGLLAVMATADPEAVRTAMPASARMRAWRLWGPVAVFKLVTAIGEVEEDQELLLAGLCADKREAVSSAAIAVAQLCQARHKKGSRVPALKVTHPMKKVAEALLNTDLDAQISAGMAGLFMLWADKDRPQSDTTKIAEAGEILTPFLSLDSDMDPGQMASGVCGWCALAVVDRKAASTVMQQCPAFVELLLERAWGRLAKDNGDAERRLVRWAAEAAVSAVSDPTIRNAIVKAGLPVVLATYATFSGQTKVKLLQLLATLSLHNEEVRKRIFSEVDFLHFANTRVDDEPGVLQAMTYLAIHGNFKQKLWADKKSLGSLLEELGCSAEDRPQAAGFYAHLVHHLARSRDTKVKQKRDVYPLNQMTEEEAEELQKLANIMPEEQKPPVNGEFDAGDPALAKSLRAYLAEHPSVIKTLCEPKTTCTPAVLASVFKLLCLEPDNRKWAVKYGGVRALLRIKDEEDAAQALAQICIVTNPKLFSYPEACDMLVVLCDLLEHRHELLQFEAAMGITNLLNLGDAVVQRAVQADAWHRLLNLIEGDDGNAMLARAGLEGLCNLTQSNQIRDEIKKGRKKVDLQIILAYIRADDAESQIAASGAIAMLSHDAEIALMLSKIDGFRNLVSGLADGGLGGDAVVHRAAVALKNCILAGVDSSAEIATLMRTRLKTFPEGNPIRDVLDDIPGGPDDNDAGLTCVREETKFRAVLGKARRLLNATELAAVEDESIDIRERTSRIMHIARTKPELMPELASS